MSNASKTTILIVLLLNLHACGSGNGGEDMGGFETAPALPDVLSLGAVWSFAPDDVWVSADSGRMFHFDGSSWAETQLDTYGMMLGIWGFAPDNVWAAGGETLARYDGATWEVTEFSELASGIVGVADIWASSPDDVWVVGSQSTAAHFDGTTWRRYLAAGPDNSVVWGSGPDDVYTASTFELGHWNGTEWTTIETGGWSSGAESIWGFGPDDVWVSDGDELSHFTGSEWELTELDFIGDASVLWGLRPDDLWGVGNFGGILHYDGSRWRQLAHQTIGSPYLRVFHGVHGSDQGDVWIIGAQMGEEGVVPLLYRRLP